MKAFVNASLHDSDGYRENRYLVFDDLVRETGPMSSWPTRALPGFERREAVAEGAEHAPASPSAAIESIDLHGALVTPGLVNGHSHLYSAFARGMRFAWKPNSFQDILDQLWWRLDRCIDPEAARLSALTLGLEQLKAGVTSTIDHHASGIGIRGTLDGLRDALCDVLGMRAVLCFETSDRFPLEDAIDENLRNHAASRPGICAGLFGLHASLSLSEASLARIAEARGGIPVHVHVAESEEDEAASLRMSGLRAVARLDRHGLLGADAICAHCTHIDETEAGILADRGCAIAVNVASNLNNAVGLPDLERFRRHGIPMILGNDSLGTNLAADLRTTLHASHLRAGNPWSFGGRDVMDMLDGARRLAGRRLGVPLDRLAQGCAADFAVYRYRPPTPIDEGNAAGHLIDGIYASMQPESVWTRGIRRIRSGESELDEEKLAAEARACARRLWERMDKT